MKQVQQKTVEVVFSWCSFGNRRVLSNMVAIILTPLIRAHFIMFSSLLPFLHLNISSLKGSLKSILYLASMTSSHILWWDYCQLFIIHIKRMASVGGSEGKNPLGISTEVPQCFQYGKIKVCFTILHMGFEKKRRTIDDYVGTGRSQDKVWGCVSHPVFCLAGRGASFTSPLVWIVGRRTARNSLAHVIWLK